MWTQRESLETLRDFVSRYSPIASHDPGLHLAKWIRKKADIVAHFRAIMEMLARHWDIEVQTKCLDELTLLS